MHSSERVGDLRNLGPATTAWLAAVGITTSAELFAQDPVAVGLAVRAAGYPFSLNGCYALAAARLGVDWRVLPEAVRQDLQLRWRAALGAGQRPRRSAGAAPRRCP